MRDEFDDQGGRKPMSAYNALLLTRSPGGVAANWRQVDEDALGDGDVTVGITHSTINYKDGLVLAGKYPGKLPLPLVPGIDFAGTVIASSNPAISVGDDVIL